MSCIQSYLGKQHEDQVEVLLLEGGDELVVHGQEVLGGVVGHEVGRHQPRQARVVQRELQQQRRLARGPRHKLLRRENTGSILVAKVTHRAFSLRGPRDTNSCDGDSKHFSHKDYTQGFSLRGLRHKFLWQENSASLGYYPHRRYTHTGSQLLCKCWTSADKAEGNLSFFHTKLNVICPSFTQSWM